MTATLDLYFERAAQAQAEADAAILENVRDRCLRSANAWAVMAQRVERMELQRLENEAAKSAFGNSLAVGPGDH